MSLRLNLRRFHDVFVTFLCRLCTCRRKLWKKNLKPGFRWDKEERINNLIQCMLSYKSEMEFERKDFTADKVKLHESVRQKMAKIYVHELSKFKLPNLERYSFMGRNDHSLDKIELEEKSN